VIVVMVVAVFVMVWPKARWVIGKGATLASRLPAIENLLHQFAVDLSVSNAHLRVDLSVKVFSAVDPSLFASRANRERRTIPEGKVCIFSDLQRTDLLIDPKLFSWVEGYELQSRVRIDPAVFDRFCRFVIHVTPEFGVVGIE
jgi:hypothetical protein